MKKLIRIARASVLSSAVEVQSKQVPVVLGSDEVAIVRKISIEATLSAAEHSTVVGLYRKSDVIPADVSNSFIVEEDNNWIIWAIMETGLAGYVGKVSFAREFNFDTDELILIRQPQIVVDNFNAIVASIMMTVFYTIRKASAKEMASLMMIYKGK